ncbi:MAG: nuclear transport factor 2 family protein [Candidatus Rokubacteria bacterium]|nr:nuclear transport factor 2 family protein [Candidatus Rokubacteria bacterium]
MANVIETAKGATIAYNDKNWDKVKAVFAENGIYDEKATSRRIQGVGKIIETWQGWAKAIPDSKATFVGEYASGDTAIIEVVWKGGHTGVLQTPTGTIPPSSAVADPRRSPASSVVGGPQQSSAGRDSSGDSWSFSRFGSGSVAVRPAEWDGEETLAQRGSVSHRVPWRFWTARRNG